jgi:hypothetical protein
VRNVAVNLPAFEGNSPGDLSWQCWSIAKCEFQEGLIDRPDKRLTRPEKWNRASIEVIYAYQSLTIDFHMTSRFARLCEEMRAGPSHEFAALAC